MSFLSYVITYIIAPWFIVLGILGCLRLISANNHEAAEKRNRRRM